MSEKPKPPESQPPDSSDDWEDEKKSGTNRPIPIIGKTITAGDGEYNIIQQAGHDISCVVVGATRNWDSIIHEVSTWARKNGHRRVIRVICIIEEVQADTNLVQITLRFLEKEEVAQENLPLIVQRAIHYNELPSEFQYLGTRVFEIPLD